MLSKHERDMLAEIETALESADPELAEKFERFEGEPGWGLMRRVLVFTALTLTAMLSLLSLAGGSPAMATAMAVLLAVASAVVASVLFAAIPFVTPASGSVPAAIGIVSQAGGIGTLAGPPLGAVFIESLGWMGFGWFLAVVALVGIACLSPLALAAKRQPA